VEWVFVEQQTLRDSRVEANTVHLCTIIIAANFNDFSMSYLDTYYSEWRCKGFFLKKKRFIAMKIIEPAAIDEWAAPSSRAV
jgi:hypothetical protein